MKRAAYRAFAVILTQLFGIFGPANGASLPLQRGIYWDEGHSYVPAGYGSRADYLKSIGVSEVHIWLNDNEWDSDHGTRCQPFSYTDSHGAVRWTRDSLVAFVRELKAANIKSIFTLSPQVQSFDYIESLSGADGPLTIAREESVYGIELDLEGNWRSDRLLQPCGKGKIAQIDHALVDAIHDVKASAQQRKPLTFIASTTAWKEKVNRDLVAMADVLAPQLYEARYAYTAAAIRAEMASLWLPYKKPMIISLNLGCRGSDIGKFCSQDIFQAGLNSVSRLSQTGPHGKNIRGYVLWSQSTVASSSFAKDWLAVPQH